VTCPGLVDLVLLLLFDNEELLEQLLFSDHILVCVIVRAVLVMDQGDLASVDDRDPTVGNGIGVLLQMLSLHFFSVVFL
jgi:hypothetical protein